MHRICILVVTILLWFPGFVPAASAQSPTGPDFDKDVAPILRKYCAGCHNDDDREGKLSVASYDAIQKGGARGAAITAGDGQLSRLVRVLTGKGEPKMPPEGSEAPKAADIELLVKWIDAGAKGPKGVSAPPLLVTPKVPLSAPLRDSIHAVAVSPLGNVVALARHGNVDLVSWPAQKLVRRLEGHSGSVNALAFSEDGSHLAAAAGEPSLFGEVRLWKLADFSLAKTFRGHRDSLQAVRLSPDGKILATGGYDQKIKLWDVASGAELRTLDGHNGPVFDLAFRPDQKILASASGDRTIKLWDVATGARLDTLNQPLQEQYAVAFSPDGRRVAAGGVDNRIRVWQVSDTGKEGTNPLEVSQFAHELAVLRLAYSRDGHTLVSTSEDRLIKVWDTDTMTIRATLPAQSDWAVGLGLVPDASRIVVGRLDGTMGEFELPAAAAAGTTLPPPLAESLQETDYGVQPPIEQLPQVTEVEPNDAPAQATAIAVPGRAQGKIHAVPGAVADVDLYRFAAKTGDQWIIETNAGRKNSPLDSKLEVLDAQGRPVPRLLLRAVRDSEIEFRSMDSNQRGVRLKNWEEMLLNEYIYINGEVIKHFQQRRGPDADSQFYPESGPRFSFFETSARAHALGQPAYVVVPYPVGTLMPNNGLPVFTLNYENDDDGYRQLGKDSRVTFVAPTDGEYLIRVSDVRGFQGDSHAYELVVRRPQPDFRITLTNANPTVGAGSGKAFAVKAERRDNFRGPIRVEFSGLPPGFQVTTPIEIQAGLSEAKASIVALEGAVEPSAEALAKIKVTATANVAGRPVEREVTGLGTIKLGPTPKVLVRLSPDPAAALPAPPVGDDGILHVVIQPGHRTTCHLSIDRREFKDRVQLEIENLPHGVIVDDIGLSGVLIPEGKTERTIFLSCEPWVPDTERLFHAVAKVDGDQVSRPMRIIVRSPKPTVPVANSP